MKRLFLAISIFLGLFCVVYAGDLLPVTNPVPTMYSLQDIYNLIHNNQAATEGNHGFSPASSPIATSSHSLSEIYADLTNLILRENIATGTVYLGVTGNYGNIDSNRSTTTVIFSSITPITPSPDISGYTLNDIYNLIVNSATTTSNNHTFIPNSGPGSSSHTLTEIYSALSNLIDSSKVKSGIIYLGKTGTYIPPFICQADINGFAGGDGSSNNPYQVCNITMLQAMRNDLSSNYILTHNIDASETLNWNGGLGFEPIGNFTTKYNGKFNGQGYAITGLTINHPSIDFVGLFGAISNTAIITNVGMLSSNFMGKRNTGGLVGHSLGLIRNSYNKGAISATGVYLGGIVGYMAGGSIIDCYNTGNINGLQAVGGIAGYQAGSIGNTYNTGSIFGSNINIGGLVGSNFGSISNSFSMGNVDGPLGSTGAFIGNYQSGTILNNWWLFNSVNTIGVGNGELGGGLVDKTLVASDFFSLNHLVYDQNGANPWNFSLFWHEPAGDYPTLR